MKTIRTILLVLCLLSLTVSLVVAQSGINITITDLGMLEGIDSHALAINDLGQVAGYFGEILSDEAHVFLWTAESGMTDLGTLGDDILGVPHDINDLSQIVGKSATSATDDGTTHAFLWTEETGMIDIGSLGGHFYSSAFGINNLGQVVGSSDTSDTFLGPRHAFLWTAETGMTDLGTLGGKNSFAADINDQGQVVGSSYLAEGEPQIHAFLWTAETGMTDLGTLGGSDSWAEGINNLGQVVGYSDTADGSSHAFLWTAETGMTDLGTLGGYGSFALEINDLGQVVGYSGVSSAPDRGFLWTAKTGMLDLGSLEDHSFSFAHDINNFGQIVGNSYVENNEVSHATLWTIASASPEDQAQVLVDQVNGFVAAGKLNDGQGNALTTKMNNVLTLLAKNKPKVACNSLNAFTNQVQSFVDEGVLYASDGQLLIQAADAIKGEVCS